MHLFVDAHGNPRPLRERTRLIRMALWLAGQRWGSGAFGRIANGLQAHSARALAALRVTLDGIARNRRSSPIALVQSGDLEAYGGTELPGQSFPFQWNFPAVDFWTTYCRTISLNGGAIIQIYGNHDVWPRTLPTLRPRSARDVEISLRKKPEFVGPIPDRLPVRFGNFTLEFYRLNTINSHFLMNTFADGKLSLDTGFYSGARLASNLNSIVAQGLSTAKGGFIVRILVMHHPPHFFQSRGAISDLLEGTLSNAGDLVPVFNTHRFHFVLAGHRHVIDPPRGSKIVAPPKWHVRQRPLPGDTVQLVAGSATQLTASGQSRPSFNVYSIIANDQQRLLRVDRTVHTYFNDLDNEFTPEPTETIIDRLPL
jgi:3',5'-cyclic AMP phosphodiesterase CpdA